MTQVKMFKLPVKKPSVVGSIEVKVGDTVAINDVLFTIETAKGKRSIKSKVAGEVRSITVEVGEKVPADTVMMEIKDCEETLATETKAVTLEKVEKDVDLLIIGAGPGGYVAAIYAALNGKKVTIIEKNKVGGTCLNIGCIPTKVFVESANLYSQAKELSLFGINAENITYDFKKIFNRKKEVIKNLTDGIAYLLQKHGVELISGEASFISDEKVEVKADKLYQLNFKDVIIATGSKQAFLGIKGEKLPCVITSTDALALEKLPKSITIIGGGVMGMEFAFIFNSFGVEINIVEYAEDIVCSLDSEVTELLRDIAKEKGMNISVSSNVTSIAETDNGMAIVTYLKDGEEHYYVSEKVLYTVGYRANSESLALENTSVKIEKGAVKVDERMRSSHKHIYAIGDVTDIMKLAHVASHQAIVAVDNILGQESTMHYDAVPAVIFTNPEIATVGITRPDDSHKLSKFEFAANGKAMVMNETEGFITLVEEKESGLLVGATIIGADASTIINTVTLAIKEKMTAKQLRAMIFPHPTTGEALHEAAMGLGIGMIHQ